MKKKTQIKQIRTKSGQIRFYQGGKRISEKKATPILKQQQKERIERGKKASKDLLYYKGKALSKAESYLLKTTLKDAVKNERRLDKIKKADGQKVFKTKAELNRLIEQQAKSLKNFFQSENVYANLKSGEVKGGRITKRGSMDVGEFLKEGAFSRFGVTLITPESKIIKGKNSVMMFLYKFETTIVSIIIAIAPEKGTQISFDYRMEISTNLNKIIIDLTHDNKASITEVITEALKTEQNVIKYYKDVTITLGYS
jgi:hypothetical protein